MTAYAGASKPSDPRYASGYVIYELLIIIRITSDIHGIYRLYGYVTRYYKCGVKSFVKMCIGGLSNSSNTVAFFSF